MKILLTSAGWENNLKIREGFLNLINKKHSDAMIFFINIAEVGSEDWKYAEKHIKELVEIGFEEKNIKILDFSEKIEASFLKGIDIIYVCGGNTFEYLYKIRKIGADKKIKELVNKGVPYFGISAGSILAGPSIDIAQICDGDENKCGVQDLSGLGLTDLSVHPHYQKGDENELQEFEKNTNHKIIRLKDDQALLIDNADVNIIS